MLRVIHRLSAAFSAVGLAALLTASSANPTAAQSPLWIDNAGVISSGMFDGGFPSHPPSNLPHLTARPVTYQSGACSTCNQPLGASLVCGHDAG